MRAGSGRRRLRIGKRWEKHGTKDDRRESSPHLVLSPCDGEGHGLIPDTKAWSLPKRR